MSLPELGVPEIALPGAVYRENERQDIIQVTPLCCTSLWTLSNNTTLRSSRNTFWCSTDHIVTTAIPLRARRHGRPQYVQLAPPLDYTLYSYYNKRVNTVTQEGPDRLVDCSLCISALTAPCSSQILHNSMNTPQSARQRRRQIDSGSLSSDGHLQDQAVAENCQVGANDESTRDKRHSPNQLCAGSAGLAGSEPECHLLKLPTELRQEIFKYLMPVRPIGSLIVYNADWNVNIGTIVTSGALRTRLPVPLLDLSLGFNCEIFEDVKDVLYSTATFAIDITRDGVTLCKCLDIFY